MSVWSSKWLTRCLWRINRQSIDRSNTYEFISFKICSQMNETLSDTSAPWLKTYLGVYLFAMYTHHFTSSGYSRHQDEILKGFNRYSQWLILFHIIAHVGGHMGDALFQSGTTKSSIVMPVNERKKANRSYHHRWCCCYWHIHRSHRITTDIIWKSIRKAPPGLSFSSLSSLLLSRLTTYSRISIRFLVVKLQVLLLDCNMQLVHTSAHTFALAARSKTVHQTDASDVNVHCS